MQLAAGALVVAIAAPAGAQGYLKSPVFLAQPGIVTTNVISAPAGSTRESGFNVRFTTVIPTNTSYLNFVAGVQFQPNGVGDKQANQPGFYYGAILPVALVGRASQGFLSLSIDPLGVYSLGGGNEFPRRLYGHDFFLEGALVANIGSKMMASNSPWSGLGAYLLLDQQMTHVGSDKFNPVFLYGLTLQIAPWGKGK
jgi:hypothetical protein